MISLEAFSSSLYNWTFISKTAGDDGNKFFMDISSITKNELGNNVAWILHNNEHDGESSIALTEFDCIKLRIRDLHSKFFDSLNGKGTVKHDLNHEQLLEYGFGDWVSPEPRSNNYYLLKAACN